MCCLPDKTSRIRLGGLLSAWLFRLRTFNAAVATKWKWREWQVLGAEIVALLTFGFTMIQVGEYAAAVLLWVFVAFVWLSIAPATAQEKPSSRWHRWIRALLSIIVAMVLIIWTNLKRGDDPWTNFSKLWKHSAPVSLPQKSKAQTPAEEPSFSLPVVPEQSQSSLTGKSHRAPSNHQRESKSRESIETSKNAQQSQAIEDVYSPGSLSQMSVTELRNRTEIFCAGIKVLAQQWEEGYKADNAKAAECQHNAKSDEDHKICEANRQADNEKLYGSLESEFRNKYLRDASTLRLELWNRASRIIIDSKGGVGPGISQPQLPKIPVLLETGKGYGPNPWQEVVDYLEQLASRMYF